MSKPLQVYETPEITVTFDPNICIHSGVCLRGLPAVFDVRRHDWVRPTAAAAQEVAAQIHRCPSGALQFHWPLPPKLSPDNGTSSPPSDTL